MNHHGAKSYDADSFEIRIMDKAGLRKRGDFRGTLQILYLLGGTVTVVYGGNDWTMYRDDIVVINSGIRYYFKGISDDVLVAEYDLPQGAFLREEGSAPGYVVCNSVMEPDRDYQRLRTQLRKLLQAYLRYRKKGFYFVAGFYAILQILADSFMAREGDQALPDEKDRRIVRIIAYIEGNFNEEPSLAELSEELGLSTAYLSRLIRSSFGMTFSQYVNVMRLKYASMQLAGTTDPVTRISMDSGFPNMKMFNTAFHAQFGVTPTEYRQRLQEENAQPKDNRDEDREIYKKAAAAVPEGEPDIAVFSYQIRYDPDKTKRLPDNWNRIISIGRISDLKNAAVRQDLLDFRQRIPVRYVRFWDVLSSEMNLGSYVSADYRDYNYAFLDENIDFLLKNEFVPYWHLTSMPKAFRITDNHSETVLEGYRSLDEVIGVYTALFTHISKRYERKVWREWVFDLAYVYPYMENCPDFMREDDGNAFPIRLNEVLRQCLPGVRIGAAGLSMTYSREEMKKRIRKLAEGNIRPDFVSCIIFPYSYETNKRRWQFSSGYIYRNVMSLREILEESPWKGLPVYVTEYGFSAFQRNLLSDMRFRGDFILNTTFQIMDEVAGIGIYMLNDDFASGADSSRILFGGHGLIGVTGLRKPAYYAYYFLQHLQPYVISKTNTYIITTDREDNYAMIFHNMRELSLKTLCSPEYRLSEEVNDDAFEDTRTLEYVFHLTGIREGVYKATENIISREHGDISYWLSQNYTEEGLSAEEQQYLEKPMMPEMRIQKLVVDATGEMTVRIRLAANDFALFQITRIS